MQIFNSKRLSFIFKIKFSAIYIYYFVTGLQVHGTVQKLEVMDDINLQEITELYLLYKKLFYNFLL